MSRRKIKAGTVSLTVPIFVQDISSTTGAGLGSLVYNSSGLAAKYRRQGDSSWTTITLATASVGTFTSGGFIADGGPVTGGYEIGIPNAAIAAGAQWVELMYYGATNMLPVLLEFELDAIDYQDGTRLGLSALPNAAAGAANGLWILGTNNNAAITIGALTTGAIGCTTITTSGVVSFGSNFTINGTLTTAALNVVGAFTATNASNDVRGITVAALANSVITTNSIADGALTAAKIAADAITAAKVAADVTTEITAGLATSSGLTALQSHGDATWSTATGFATVNPDNSGIASAASSAASAASSAASAASSSTSILGKMNGIGSFARWLAAIMGIGPDTTTRSEINALASGAAATYNETTMSLQALSTGLDAVPTASEIRVEMDTNSTKLGAAKTMADNFATMIQDDGASGKQFTELSLDESPAGSGGGSQTINVMPFVGSLGRQSAKNTGITEVFQFGPLPYGPYTINDANNDPVDLTGATANLVIESMAEGDTTKYTLATGVGGKLTVTGADQNQVVISGDSTEFTGTAGDWKWNLRVVTQQNAVTLWGTYRIQPFAKGGA